MYRVASWSALLLFVWIAKASPETGTRPAWTATVEEYMAASMAGERLTPTGSVAYVLPEGFRGYSDTPDAGFGRFRIGLPEAWSAWLLSMGRSADPIIGVFEAIDPNWAEMVRRSLASNIDSGRFTLRGMFALLEGDHAAVVEVSVLGRLNDRTLDGFRKDPEGFYRNFHRGELQEVAWFDHLGTEALRASVSYDRHARDRLGYLIVEEANRVLWHVVCAFPESRARHYRMLCDEIVGTFAPGAFIERPGG